MSGPLTLRPRPAFTTGVLLAAVAFGGAYFTGDYASDWYRALAKPRDLLPERLEQSIALVWAVLYLLAGVALGAVLAADRRTAWKVFALGLFAAQLGLNYAYSTVFTIHRDLTGAVWVAAGLTAATALLILACASGRVLPAAVCLLPYLAWATYATVVTAAVARLNLS